MTVHPPVAPSDWTFEDFGPEFDAHVARHLPGYADVQRLVALVASFAVPYNGRVADLGCSTGASAEALRHALQRPVSYVLYDADASMLDEAAERLGPEVDYHHGELPRRGGLQHRDADLTLALWFLQFLPPSERRVVLAQARVASRTTGAIVVAAKTRHGDSRWEDIAVAALDDYKAEAGVDADERAAKTRSLRGRMFTATTADYLADLRAAGWHSPVVLWRWHVWSVIGAWAKVQNDDVAS